MKSNNNSKKKMMKKKKKNINATDITLPECESKKPDSLPQKQDTISNDLDKLFQKVKAKVETLKAAGTTNASNIPLHDESSSTPDNDKTCSLEITIENKELDCLPDSPVILQGAQATADAETLLVHNKIHKPEDIMLDLQIGMGLQEETTTRMDDDNNNVSVGVVKSKKKKMRKKNKNTTDITLPECESKKPDSLPQKQDTISNDLDKLFEKVKAKVEALKAAGTANASNIPLHDKSFSTPDKACSLEKTIENKELDCLPDSPVIPQGAQVTADAETLLVHNRVHKPEDITELSSCKGILKEYADKINAKNLIYITEKSNRSKSAFVSSLTFNGKEYVGDEGRSKKESQRLVARAVILSILDSDARSVFNEIIKSKKKMFCPSKDVVCNPCNTRNVSMPMGMHTGHNIGTSTSNGNEFGVVNDNMLQKANQEPCAGNLSGVSAKPIPHIEELSCKQILKEYAEKINVENPIYKIEKTNGSKLAFVSSLTFNGKQYVGDKGRNKKESQNLAARVVIQSIFDARDVISKIIKSKEKMLCPAMGNVSTGLSKGNELEVAVNDNMLKTATQEQATGNSSSVIAKPVSLVEASGNTTIYVSPNSEKLVTGSTSSKKRKRNTKNAMPKTATQEPCTGNSYSVTAKPVSLVETSGTKTLFVPPNLEKLVTGSTSVKKRKRKTKNDILNTGTQEACTRNLSSVTVKPVSLVEASGIPTLFVPPNSEKLVTGSTSSKKKKHKTKKAEHKVGIDAQVQVAAVPSNQTTTSTDYIDQICVPNNCVSLPGSDNVVLCGS